MARKDEILFEAFESLSEEMRGMVIRGGIFTAQHPRLKGTFRQKEVSLFFHNERGGYYLCVRINHTFPAMVVIKPRYKQAGIFDLDINFRRGHDESGMIYPYNEHFIITSDNTNLCLIFLNGEIFKENFQELLSPGIVETRFFETFHAPESREERGETGLLHDGKIDFVKLEKELEKLTVPKKRFFFYPALTFDRRGAFLKVRFDLYHETNKKRIGERRTGEDYTRELKEVMKSYLNALCNLLDEGDILHRSSVSL